MSNRNSVKMLWDEMYDDLLTVVLWGIAIYLPMIIIPLSTPALD